MMFRQITAVLLGVLLHVPLLCASITTSAAAETVAKHTSCCCQDLPVCPCIEPGKDEKPSLPAITVSQERQSPVILPTDPEIPGIATRAGSIPGSQTRPTGDTFHGYCGVALRVSFCRYTV